jgi:hypothetical protein
MSDNILRLMSDSASSAEAEHQRRLVRSARDAVARAKMSVLNFKIEIEASKLQADTNKKDGA